jgi:hypothetical protein
MEMQLHCRAGHINDMTGPASHHLIITVGPVFRVSVCMIMPKKKQTPGNSLPDEVNALIQSFLPSRVRIALLRRGETSGGDDEHISRGHIIRYYERYWCKREASDAAVLAGLVASRDQVFRVTTRVTWRRHVERGHSEEYEQFGGWITIGDQTLACDGCVEWWMQTQLKEHPQWHWFPGGYADICRRRD